MATRTNDVDANPYASPSAVDDAPIPSKRFRWRVIPTLLTALYGMAVGFGGLFGAGMAVFGLISGNIKPGGAALVAGIAVGLLIDAVVWVLAARCWWRGRWWWAVLLSVLAYVPGVIASYLLEW